MTTPRSSITAGRASEAARFDRATLGALLVAAAVRLVACARLPALTYDGTYYLRAAARLAQGHYDFIGFPPGYPAAILFVQALLRDPVLAARSVSFVAGLATIPLALRLGRLHLAPRWALGVALYLAVHPFLARAQVETLSESLYVFLVVAALLLFELRHDLATGLLLGYAFLVRPEAFLLLATLLVARGVEERRWPWRLALGLLPIAAYAIAASHAVGHPVLSPKQAEFDLGPKATERATTLGLAIHACFPLVLVPGALVYGARWLRLFLVPIAYVATITFFDVHVQERLLLPALPFLAILAAAWLARLPRRWQGPVGAAAVVFGLWGGAPGWKSLVDSPPLSPDAGRIGTALRPYLHFDDRVAGRFPMVAYYAGAGFVRAPREAGYDALMDSIQTRGATHLLVLESEMQGILPQLRPLFGDAGFVESEGRLRAVAWVDSPPGGRAILYRLQPPAIPSPATVPACDGVDAAFWMGSVCVAARQTGELLRLPERLPLVPGAALRQPSASADGAWMAGVASASGRLCRIDVRRGTVEEFPATAADSPAWPTWVGDRIVYVRRQAPGGLRVLDPAGTRPRPVELLGVAASQAVPQFVTARGNDVAITYEPPSATRGRLPIVAVAAWPATATGDSVRLAGRWAVELRLADPVTSWVPGADALVVSLVLATSDGMATAERSSLCVVHPGGHVRRLTFGLDAPRRPALTTTEIAFLTGTGDLRLAPLGAAALDLAPVRVFPATPQAPHPGATPSRPTRSQ